jgi:hypothetical protein
MKNLILLLFLAAPVFLIGQSTIKGHVVDQDGNPINRAKIVAEGANAGTLTDASGSYQLTVPDSFSGGTITITASGMRDIEVELPEGNYDDWRIVAQMDPKKKHTKYILVKS